MDTKDKYVREQIDKVIRETCKRKGKTQKKPKKTRATNVPSNYLAVSKDEMPKCDCNAERLDEIQKGRLLLYEQKRKGGNAKTRKGNDLSAANICHETTPCEKFTTLPRVRGQRPRVGQSSMQ